MKPESDIKSGVSISLYVCVCTHASVYVQYSEVFVCVLLVKHRYLWSWSIENEDYVFVGA